VIDLVRGEQQKPSRIARKVVLRHASPFALLRDALGGARAL